MSVLQFIYLLNKLVSIEVYMSVSKSWLVTQNQVPFASEEFSPSSPMFSPCILKRLVPSHVLHKCQPGLLRQEKLNHFIIRSSSPTSIVERCSSIIILDSRRNIRIV
mmetsp:Transcript_12564/g.24528  ORF Transcript_12564/g.24528 Transcript_12564/m.24528 type:complete len:107 (-) Transcript_12564:771-1091(-)